MSGNGVNPLAGLNPREHADWAALTTLTPRQIARRLHLSVNDATCLQAFGKVILMVQQRIHAKLPFDDLERKAAALIDGMSMRVKKNLFDDWQIKKHYDAINNIQPNKPLVTLK